MLMTEIPALAANATRASRAIGAMFYSTFGGAWIGFAAWNGLETPVPALIGIVAATLAILWLAFRQFQNNRSALESEPKTPATERRDRWFHIVNAGQWVVILIVGNVLANMGLGKWVIPAAIFIIGLHFIPLAALFQNQAHYVTGGALILASVIYPALTAPTNPIGALCAGLILWASALWVVRPALNSAKDRP